MEEELLSRRDQSPLSIGAARNAEASEIDPLEVLAVATSARIDDPRLEHERVVLVGIAIAAGRDAVRVLDTWLQQSLAEHRGSRSKWDLEESTGMLRHTLARYHETLVDTAEQLARLVPSVRERFPSLAAAADGTRPRRHVLEELEIASRMLATITSRVAECGQRDRLGRCSSTQPQAPRAGSLLTSGDASAGRASVTGMA